jgi:UDP-N-acetylglucosamine 4,6-dehydratase
VFCVLTDSSILVTGGTGSFGQEFVRMTLDHYSPRRIVVFSRDEMKHWDMAKKYAGDPRIRFFIGDVRDKDRLYRALDGIDYVVHGAATKIVKSAEYNPFECVKTNVIGAMNVIDACLDRGVKRVIALSTDKASSPVNLYGATKLTSDKLFIAGNSYTGDKNTKFAVVRYGNVMGSRGSIIPFLQSLKDSDEVPLTDMEMTRFMISLQDAVRMVWHAFVNTVGGEIFVRKLPSVRVVDLIHAIKPNNQIKVIGILPGEKLHEEMISRYDARYTYDFGQFFKIMPAINDWYLDPARIGDGTPVRTDFEYTSNSNTDWLNINMIRDWVSSNALFESIETS